MENNELETNRLLLRKSRKQDLENIYNNIWSSKEVSKSMLWDYTKTIEEAELRLNKTITYQKYNYAYFVCLKETDEVIGFAGIKKIEEGIYEVSF